MSTDGHRERVAATIRISSQPLDDDQVAARTGIILCLIDPLAAAPFLPGARTWASRALRYQYQPLLEVRTLPVPAV